MKFFTKLISLVIFIFILPQAVFAQESWIINSFDANYSFEQQTGEMKVRERIDVDFDGLEKHGIYRDIPYIYQNDDGSQTYTQIDNVSVQQDGRKAETEISKNDANIRIRIGDPDQTVSGKHMYEISYSVQGILRSFSDYDEVYWNVTGNYWEVPIQKVSATVTLPREGIKQTSCYQGGFGSTETCTGTKPSDRVAVFLSTRELFSSEGMTFALGYTKGMLPVVTVPRPKTFIEKFTSVASQVTLASVLLFGIGTVLVIWYKYGRDFWFGNIPVVGKSVKKLVKPVGGKETVVVEFTSPENLRPAEIGVLMDERAHTHDVVATIIDLATRGYLTITEVPKQWLFGSTDYTLAKKSKVTSSLLPYEKKLYDELFASGDEVKVSSLKQTFYDELAEVKKQLYEDMVSKKFFPSNPEKVRQKYLLIGILVATLGGVSLFYSFPSENIYFFDIGVGVLTSGLVLAVLSAFMSKRTAHGREMYRKARGYLLFINGAEKYRQRFFEQKNLFNEILPYAVMFGLTEKFITAMKDIGLPERQLQPGWYYGTHVFNATTFSSNMNSFATSLSTAIASTPSSSGSSGGGFSGGGFGGGGGGSW